MSFPRRSARLAAKANAVTNANPEAPPPVVRSITIISEDARVRKIWLVFVGSHQEEQNTNSPRRSARLANKKTPIAKDKYVARRLYQEWHEKPISDEYKQFCIDKINGVLDKFHTLVGKVERARECIGLIRFLQENAVFMAAYPKFSEAVLKKMKSLQEETIEDTYVHETFHKVLKDIVFVLTGK
jgi:hypothetical protein